MPKNLSFTKKELSIAAFIASCMFGLFVSISAGLLFAFCSYVALTA